MSSSIGWIDFSSEHRDKVRTVLDLLSTPGVIDELGIGVIRDSFADRMFPGISTIQTRAKYFTLTALLIWRFQHHEHAKPHPRSLERYLEDEERRCRISLVEKHGEERQNLGIIGGTFGLDHRRDVVRRASSVYWNGLRQFGFITPRHLSLAEFARRFSDDRRQLRALLKETRDEPGDDQDAEDGNLALRVWVPEIDPDYWDELSIDLTPKEAEFLRHQITAHQPDSLIGQILMEDARMDQVLQLSNAAGFEEFADLPFIGTLKSGELRRAIQHARDFWVILEGAHIRYNCLLQEAGFGTAELRERFEEQWTRWRERTAAFPADWDSGFMWALVSKHGSRVKESTKKFIDGWIDETRNGAANRQRCDELVTRQERLNKGNRARLRPGNQEAIRDWVGLNGAGYRLTEVRQLVADIRSGEGTKGATH